MQEKIIMKQITIIITIILSIVSVTAFAHSGKTDASGGHTDRSTGEYHYHHGYSAHQHTNGVCPYNFKDKTGINSGSSSGSSSGTVRRIPFSTDSPSTLVPTTPTPTEEPQDNIALSVVKQILMCIVCIPIIVMLLMCCPVTWLVLIVGFNLYLWISDIVKRRKPKPKKTYIAPALTIPKLKYGGIPERVCIDESLLPYISDRLNGYGKRYNVYITHNGHCYHRNSCSSLKNDKQLIHLYQAIDSSNFKPCGKCKPRDIKEDWYIEMFPEINSATAMEQFIALQRIADKRKNATIEKIEKGLNNKGKEKFRQELAEARAKDRADAEKRDE